MNHAPNMTSLSTGTDGLLALPELDSLADLAYAQHTPDDWDADYRATWQKLQVAERNKMQWRAYALMLRAAMTNELKKG